MSYRTRELLDDEALHKALKSFLAESEKMIRLGSLRILPLTVDCLTETYALLPRHHIYQADTPSRHPQNLGIQHAPIGGQEAPQGR